MVAARRAAPWLLTRRLARSSETEPWLPLWSLFLPVAANQHERTGALVVSKIEHLVRLNNSLRASSLGEKVILEISSVVSADALDPKALHLSGETLSKIRSDEGALLYHVSRQTVTS